MTEILPNPLCSVLTAKSGSASFQLFLPLEQHVRNVTAEVLVEELGAVRAAPKIRGHPQALCSLDKLQSFSERLLQSQQISTQGARCRICWKSLKALSRCPRALQKPSVVGWGCFPRGATGVEGVSWFWAQEDCCCVLTYRSGFQGVGPLSFWRGERHCCCSRFR